MSVQTFLMTYTLTGDVNVKVIKTAKWLHIAVQCDSNLTNNSDYPWLTQLDTFNS